MTKKIGTKKWKFEKKLRKNGKHSSTFGNHEIEKTQWEG
jgi:hypothetical protein